jgi:hypothetical protein
MSALLSISEAADLRYPIAQEPYRSPVPTRAFRQKMPVVFGLAHCPAGPKPVEDDISAAIKRQMNLTGATVLH